MTAALADLGCKDPEGVKKEEEGIYEIDDAKCKMGTMDIKLDKDFSVILISRLFRAIRHATPRAQRGRRTTAT